MFYKMYFGRYLEFIFKNCVKSANRVKSAGMLALRVRKGKKPR